MTDKIIPIHGNSETLSKKDLELVLLVNKQAVEIETAVAEQNEEIIDHLEKNQEYNSKIMHMLEVMKKENEELSRGLFRMQVLFVGGLIPLVIQIIQLFLKK